MFVGVCFDIQLKGFGFILYLWCGDGWVIFSFMLCEYLISEVMYYFGIFISWSLVVVVIGELVYRSLV